MGPLKALVRDIVLIAIGANLSLVALALMMDNNDLAMLAGCSLLLCAVGITAADMTTDREDSDEK